MLYEINAPPFGRLLLTADDRAEAVQIARRFKGASAPKRIIPYRHCQRCDSAPCTCPRKPRGRR